MNAAMTKLMKFNLPYCNSVESDRSESVRNHKEFQYVPVLNSSTPRISEQNPSATDANSRSVLEGGVVGRNSRRARARDTRRPTHRDPLDLASAVREQT